MPIRQPNDKEIQIVLGYGDIGIGHLDGEFKGVGFAQLSQPYAVGETISEEDKDRIQGREHPVILLVFKNERGLAEVRKAIASVEKLMGIDQNFMDRILTAELEELGQKSATIERLEYENRQLTEKLKQLEAAVASSLVGE